MDERLLRIDLVGYLVLSLFQSTFLCGFMLRGNRFKYQGFTNFNSQIQVPLIVGGFPVVTSVILFFAQSASSSNGVAGLPMSLLGSFVASFLLIAVFGMIDDFYEIRALVKLSFQLISFFPLAFTASTLLFPNYILQSFLLTYALSILLVNSVNLIDGIDTVTIRNSVYVLLVYLVLNTLLNNHLNVIFIFLLIGALVGVYNFNRSPAKIYFGELGVTTIALCFIIISLLTIKHMEAEGIPVLNSLFLGTVPIAIICGESIISFVRRIFSGKSPLAKDRLHFHHILTGPYDFNHSNAAKIIGLINFSFISLIEISFLQSISFGILMFSFSIISIFVIQANLSYEFWFPNGLSMSKLKLALFRRNPSVIFPSYLKIIIHSRQSKSVKKDQEYLSSFKHADDITDYDKIS